LKRIVAFVLALVFAVTMRIAYRDVIVASQFWDYFNINWYDPAVWHSQIFLVMGALPALWMPQRIRQPSDLAAIIIFVVIYMPIIVLLPHVSQAPTQAQLIFAMFSTAGVTLISLVGTLPAIKLNCALPPNIFWLLIGLVYVGAWLLLIQSGRLSFSAFDQLIDIYQDRLALREVRDDFSALYHYGIANTMFVLGPFLVAYGCVKRKWLPIALSFLVVMGAFAATTFKSAYLAFFGVVGIFWVMKLAPRSTLAIVLVAFLAMTAGGAAIDYWRVGPEDYLAWSDIPRLTWTFFFRHLGNSALLNAGYFEALLDNEKLLYPQRFMSGVLEPRYDTAIARLIGEAWTGKLENNANVNFLSDAFANLSFAGVIVICLMLSAFLYVYNCLAWSKNLNISSLLLLIPILSLSNIGLHTAMLSTGLLISMLLVAGLPVEAANQNANENEVRPDTSGV